ncbi:protein TPX2 isoform X1 [Punica granatum]|uniref:Protein TPX2 isoform X1 n=1 Tax=Punica granatum TaxID=22663 RepID=A0A6P8CQ74_PUNGR|nr:protein TPX2 isoform X1 [Punica granatum]
MDEDMDEFYCVEVISVEEYDPDYEFEAPRYFDFSRPETDWEVEEAQRWFESAGTCPPSPFIAKMNWGKGLYFGAANIMEEEDHKHMNSISTDMDCSMGPETSSSVQYNGVEETWTVPKKSPVKPSPARSSTLMKPTASHLAKQRQCQEVHFHRLLSCRSQKFQLRDQETTSQHSSIIENYATKRQKLEAGYLQKAANLKHRAVLHHKLSETVSKNVDSLLTRLRVTVPREPHLETAQRALRHRSKHVAESAECIKSNLPSMRAQNVDRKIQECLPKKVTTPLPESRIVDTPNPITVSQSGETESNRSKSYEATKLKTHEVKQKLRARPPDKELKLSTCKHDVPITSFQKLTLESEVWTNLKSQPKCLKENAPVLVQQVQQVVKPTKEKPLPFAGKQLPRERAQRNNPLTRSQTK